MMVECDKLELQLSSRSKHIIGENCCRPSRSKAVIEQGFRESARASQSSVEGRRTFPKGENSLGAEVCLARMVPSGDGALVGQIGCEGSWGMWLPHVVL